MKIWPFVYYDVEKKHKEDFPVLFPQQLDDHGLMGMLKIGTDATPV